MLIASWNINSLRHRAAVLRRFVRKYQPDVICLQETKVPDELFPSEVFDSLAYPHVVYRGQKGYHGVAIASRLPLVRSWSHAIHRTRDQRHIAIELASGLEVHNVYFPAGGDDPRPERNPKFASKLAFIRAATRWMKRWEGNTPRVLLGDLNVAPLETDVWSHVKLRRSITHTPIEIDLIAKMQRSQRWIDVAREFVPADEKLFTWWSYRSPNFRKANKGRRLDHVWASPSLRDALRTFRVADEVRGWKNPSDHAPLLCEIDF
jgi:exodeoxyribonuclease-3